jgi:hypothetical protein
MSTPLGTILISLTTPPDGQAEAGQIRQSLSACVQVGRHLFLGCDETATLERVTDLGGGRWGEHRTYSLADVLDLPGKADDEVDVEGLAWDPPYLWIAGSHGRKRGRPRDKDDVDAAFERLADVDTEPNRYLLARIPLEYDAESQGPVPRRSCPHPRDPSVTLTAARVKGKGRNSMLMRALEDDPHLRRFLRLPGKDNGFDLEGLAAADGRVFLGLRGPVLHGWALVLELQPEEGGRPERLRLKRIGPEGRRYRKHALQLAGLGVREVTRDGDDLLVMAGPTMGVRAPALVYRWSDAVKAEADSVVPAERLERLLELPHDVDGNQDHPEGMCRFHAGDADGLLVVYDSAAEHRQEAGGVRMDVFEIPRAGGVPDTPASLAGGGHQRSGDAEEGE